MGRQLDASTLDLAARHYAREFTGPDITHPHGDHLIAGREYMLTSLFGFTFKDEFEYLYAKICSELGPNPLKEFEREAKDRFTPRDDKVFADFLADKLAIDVNGEHLAGKIGTTNLGSRVVGRGYTVNGYPKHTYWPVYAGEEIERAAESGAADEIPHFNEFKGVGALNTVVSYGMALLGANAAVDNLDEGSVGGVIEGREGAQPTDPDTGVAGVLLFTLLLADPAFSAATDAAPGALKTANAIGDDTSADATNTLGYCRASSSNSQPTPLDDHIDGEAGVTGADFNFNTLAIVAGATVSMTAWTITWPEG